MLEVLLAVAVAVPASQQEQEGRRQEVPESSNACFSNMIHL